MNSTSTSTRDIAVQAFFTLAMRRLLDEVQLSFTSASSEEVVGCAPQGEFLLRSVLDRRPGTFAEINFEEKHPERDGHGEHGKKEQNEDGFRQIN